MSSFSPVAGAAIEKAIADGVAFKAFQQNVAEAVASTAQELAPGSEGQFINAEDGKVVFANPRAVWHIVEFGSANNRPYSPLRRAVTASGLRLSVAPKP